jgi:hypothetical protein
MIWLDNIDSYTTYFTYDPFSNIFQIGKNKFRMNNIVEAEEIIKKFIDVNGSKIPPLFKHINDIRKEKIDDLYNEKSEDDN